MAEKHEPGIARFRDGWRVYKRVQGHLRTKQLPLATTPKALREAREALGVDLRRELDAASKTVADERKPTAFDDPFDRVVPRYLDAVSRMPTYSERERDMALWVEALGDRPCSSIVGADLRPILNRWLTEGPKMVQRRSTEPRTPGTRRPSVWVAIKGPLAASTVNHRKRALENFYTVMFPQHRNPARDVPEEDPPDAPPRAIPAEWVEAIFAALPDRGIAAKGKKRPKVSQSKARLQVMAWAGLPPAQLKLLKPEHVHWAERTMLVTRRKKGRKGGGLATQDRPITKRGLQALKALDDARAWGPFSESTVLRAWHRACDQVARALEKKGVAVEALAQLRRLRPYDLRHTYASTMLQATKRLDATQQALGHADPRTTLTYARAAVPEWMVDATRKLDALQRTAGQAGKSKKSKKSKQRRRAKVVQKVVRRKSRQ